MPTYNEAVDNINISERKSPYEQKIKTMQLMVAQQEEAIQKQEKLIELNQQKAELIYEKYQPLQKMLQIVAELRKNKNWGEIEQELHKEKKIKRIDLKNKKIMVEL